jgi:hypothetical protein
MTRPAVATALTGVAPDRHSLRDDISDRLPDSARTLAVGAIRGTPRSALIERKGIALDTVIDKLATRLAEVGGAAPYRSYAQALIVGARKAA